MIIQKKVKFEIEIMVLVFQQLLERIDVFIMMENKYKELGVLFCGMICYCYLGVKIKIKYQQQLNVFCVLLRFNSEGIFDSYLWI